VWLEGGTVRRCRGFEPSRDTEDPPTAGWLLGSEGRRGQIGRTAGSGEGGDRTRQTGRGIGEEEMGGDGGAVGLG
jgi:hypothetical protein